MAGTGRQMSGEGLPANLAGMSKNQLYDIMSQMKTLIEQNPQQARKILIQNPVLTKALFQAQIMLGMVQPPQPVQSTQQQLNIQELSGASQAQNPNLNPVRMQQTLPQAIAPKPTPISAVPQSSSQNPSHVMTVQPPLPPQPRPSFQHHYPPPQQQQQQQQQMGTSAGFQHPQHLPHLTYHTSNKPPPHVFPHPNQPPPQPVYQARGTTEFNSQGDRGGGSSSWAENPTQPRPQQQQPPPPPPQLQGQLQSALSPEMEKALLQQVMSLTPEQINLLPSEQRNQVLHLQQILRQ